MIHLYAMMVRFSGEILLCVVFVVVLLYVNSATGVVLLQQTHQTLTNDIFIDLIVIIMCRQELFSITN
jgi:hypothetical protein